MPQRCWERGLPLLAASPLGVFAGPSAGSTGAGLAPTWAQNRSRNARISSGALTAFILAAIAPAGTHPGQWLRELLRPAAFTLRSLAIL